MGRFSLLFLILAIVLPSSFALADKPLPPGVLLKRLSLKLRGTHPTRSEIASFRRALEAAPNDTLKIVTAMAKKYMRSDEYYGILHQFHAAWWELPLTETTLQAAWVAFNNRSYSEVFQREYIILDGASANARYRRYSPLTDYPLPGTNESWQIIRLSEEEKRFRTFLSGVDLLSRFPDTDTNKNRARAAFVFRNMFCQEVTPDKIPDGFPDDNSGEHGSNKDCQGCHYKLDPMARMFDQWLPGEAPPYDSNKAAAGAIIYYDRDGKSQQIKAKTLADLSKKLWVIEEVKRCIVTKAWEFVHGEEVLPEKSIIDANTARFKNDENFNNIVLASVRHKYFWTNAEPPPIKYGDVKKNLKLCATCHKKKQKPLFDTAKWPFLADKAANKKLAKRIWGAINGKEGYKMMPPSPIPPISETERSKIRAWIEQGAHDDKGKKHFTDADAKEVLGD